MVSLFLTWLTVAVVVLPSQAKYLAIIKPIIGGSIAEDGFAPYQISIQFFGKHVCGGAIIDHQWILTTSKCVKPYLPGIITIATGSNKRKFPTARYYVDKIHIHCNSLPHNDIALLHLSSSIVFNNKTQPVELPIESLREGDDVILTGWGATDVLGNMVNDLHKITLKYLPHGKCKQMLNNHPDLDVGHICTFTKEGEGSCHKDSGGPLVSKGRLMGLVSWVVPCAVGMPDVHTSIWYYRDWIRRTMSDDY